MATTKEDRSFKQLINKRVTSADKAFYEEIGDETLIITNGQIWASPIAENDPDAAVEAGSVEFVEKLVLTEDITVSSQQSWFAEDGYRLKDWVSDRFGSAYTLKLFDNNDQEIFPTDALDWFWDYPTGILTISGDTSPFPQPFKVDGYRYVGRKGIISQTLLAESIEERNSISLGERSPQMLVRVLGDGYGAVWRLAVDSAASNNELLDNANWVIESPVSSVEFFPEDRSFAFDNAIDFEVNFYVSTSGDDVNNNGTEASPFATIQRVVDMLPKRLNVPVTINLSAGNFSIMRQPKFWDSVSEPGRLRIAGYKEPVEGIIFPFPSQNNIVGDDGYERYAQQFINFGSSYSTSLTEGDYFLYHTDYNSSSAFNAPTTYSAIVLDGSQGTDGYIANRGRFSCLDTRGDVAISAWNTTIIAPDFENRSNHAISISSDGGKSFILQNPIFFDSCKIDFSNFGQNKNEFSFINCCFGSGVGYAIKTRLGIRVSSCYFNEAFVDLEGPNGQDLADSISIQGSVFKDTTLIISSGNVELTGSLFTGDYSSVSRDYIIYLGFKSVFNDQSFISRPSILEYFGQNDFDPRNYGLRISKGIVRVGDLAFIGGTGLPRGDMYINTSENFIFLDGGNYKRLDGRYYGFVGKPSVIENGGVLNIKRTPSVWDDTSLANFNNPGQDIRVGISGPTVSWSDNPTTNLTDLSRFL